MNLGTRLGLAFASLLVLTTVLVSFGISQMSSLSESLNLISEDRVPKVQSLANVTDDVNLIARELRNTLIFDDPSRVNDATRIAVDARTRIAATLDDLSPSIRSEDGRERLDATLRAREAYVPLQNKFIELVRDGQKADAEELLVSQMREAQLAYMDALDQFKNFQVDLVTESAAAGSKKYRSARWTLLSLLGGMGLLGALLAWRIVNSVTGPIKEAVVVAERVASGDLTSEIEIRKHDETGRLLVALKQMNQSLVEIVGTVRSSSESIAAGSKSIANGSSDLSHRAVAQTDSLRTTTASVEQLDATVKVTAENARQANDLAATTRRVAVKGGEAVNQVVDAMKGVTASSRRIDEIISVIDGIAFQTNLLALNAAVEAARAGDHGKGFAVVASEVGDLARRSADAAGEIKSLIKESGSCVKKSTTLVDEAGVTMEEILASVAQVTTLISEISVASDDQSNDLSLVGSAMTEIDRVTQQNAALVDTSAVAAETLRQEVHELVNAVAVFRV